MLYMFYQSISFMLLLLLMSNIFFRLNIFHFLLHAHTLAVQKTFNAGKLLVFYYLCVNSAAGQIFAPDVFSTVCIRSKHQLLLN